MPYDTTPFDASITVRNGIDGEIHSERIKAVGSMDNAKRHAKRIADSLNLKPTMGRWITSKTYYAPTSGLHGGWESRAYREYITKDDDIPHSILILRN